MEYYLTTYTKDFKWPVNHTPYREKKNAEHKAKLVHEQIKAEPCAVYRSQPLEEPIIDPAQCGAPPAGPESKYGQPVTYLRKLYLKYPYLYQILKLTPPEELAKTIYSDKFLSTYNADFKVQGFSPLKNWLASEQDQPNKAQTSGLEWPANEPTRGINDQAASGQPPPQQGEHAFKFVGGSHPPKLGKWKTEYRDTISKVGGIIITKKLHSRLPIELQDQNKK